jgi:hypothetical protein
LFCNCCNYTYPALSCQSWGKKEKKDERDEERKKKRKEPCEKGLPLKRNDYRLCVPPRGDFADFLLENLSSVRRSASEQV